MRVLFNCRAALGRKTGIGHYASHLFRSLQEVSGDSIAAYPPRWMVHAQQELAHLREYWRRLRERFPRSRLPLSASLLGGASRHLLRAMRRLASSSVAHVEKRTFFSKHYDVYLEPNFIPHPSSLPTITTLHDLSVVLHPEWHPIERVRWFERHFQNALRQTRHFLTGSEFTRQEIIKVLGIAPERVTRVCHGIHPGLSPLPADYVRRSLQLLGLPPRYLLYLGTIEPRKNVLRLMKAFCSLPESMRMKWPLVLVGGWGWKVEAEFDYYREEARQRGVIHLGYVADEHLAVLYNGARALVYPSWYEGFGLPPVEMMACGGAVLASTAGAVVETLGVHAHLVDPENEDGWRQAMLDVVSDDDWWRSLRSGAVNAARQYSWQRCALETRDVYHSLCGAAHDRPARRLLASQEDRAATEAARHSLASRERERPEQLIAA